MARPTLEEIGQRVSELPPLADPTLDAALAFINDLGGIENLKQEHILSTDEQTAPLVGAIRTLIALQHKCYEWGMAACSLKPIISTHAPPEYGL